MEVTTEILSGRYLEQARVGVDEVTLSAEVDRKVVSALVAKGLVGLNEETVVSDRKEIVIGVTISLVVEAV